MNFDLKSLQLGAAFSLMLRTRTILLIKMGAYLVFWFVALVYLGVTFLIASLVGQAIPIVGVILFIVALGAMIPLYDLAYRYVFFMIKAAHIAVLSELLARGALPAGVSQLDWGRQQVQRRFGETNAMFVVDELVSSVIRAFTRTVYVLTAWLPGDTLQQIVRIINRVVYYATTYIDEAILARSFIKENVPVWVNARDGVVLYAMVWKPLLMNAIALMILSYVPFIVGFLVFAAPIGLIASVVSPSLGGWAVIATLVLAFLIKVAVGDAFAMTAMIAAYHRETKDMKPNQEAVAKLDAIGGKFQELKTKAQAEIDRYLANRAEKAKNSGVQTPPSELSPASGSGDGQPAG
ncbi:MAG: hypothetical protein HXY40_10125 [Chloroflexi bacterium]|nr:hypothetical protein [Chloroflexota bacterium]